MSNLEKEKKYEKPDRKGIFDHALEKVVSRKLTVWCFATGLLIAGTLTPEHWIYISLAYIGSQGMADIVATVKKAR